MCVNFIRSYPKDQEMWKSWNGNRKGQKEETGMLCDAVTQKF